MANQKSSKQSDSHNSSSHIPKYLPCGYRVYGHENAENKWRCIFCDLIMKEPVQLVECGHRSCRGCYESRAADAIDEMMACPVKDCELYDVKFDKSDMMPDRAFKRELDALQIACFHKTDKNCTWTGQLKSYQEHLDQSHVDFNCDSCQAQFSTYQALIDHQSNNCPAIFQMCELGPVCSDQWIRKDQYGDHLFSEHHQETLALLLTGKSEISEPVDQEQTMESSTPINALEQETSDKLADLADKVQTLNDQTVDLSREFVKLNELTQVAVQEVNHFQTAVNERNTVMSSLQPKQEAIQKEIEQIKLSLEENQHVSMDGTLTWRVDRVAERMADAQSERQPSIYSPIFYSSPTGFRMRARLYLHGDGNARRTHMSLFFLLMKGDYDALLPWPFKYKVTFCLFDQTGNNRHIIDSFRPDVKSNSFQRPKTDANIASGIPKFFPLPMIQQDDNPYVRDDTLFLKIVVDLHDTPKMILPYMLTLNPGLPNHVQQILINQETVKRQQQQNNATALASTQVPTNTCG